MPYPNDNPHKAADDPNQADDHGIARTLLFVAVLSVLAFASLAFMMAV